MRVRLLGPVAVTRGAEPVAIARSRKVRALLAFLALSPTPVSRSQLCDLLWDVPNDPRGELRWCLSKLRGVLGARRVITSSDNTITLDLSDCFVDALAVDRATRGGIDQLPSAELAALCDSTGGDFLDGLSLDGSPELTAWLTAQRHRYRALHADLLARLVASLPAESEETFRRLEEWHKLAPFDVSAHRAMLEVLVKRGLVPDAEEHVRKSIRAFEREGADWTPLRDAWQAMRAEPARIEVTAPVPPPGVERPLRASVAVMPFVDRVGGRNLADGLTDDVITRLAKLRVLFVIARGTVYALRDRAVEAREAARLLDVTYFVSGTVRHERERVSVGVEVVETATARIVWTDSFEGGADETFSVLDTIVDRIVAGIAEEIETAECKRALLKPPSSLDAWESYHRGLWHMYKFNGPDNQQAERFFRDALKLDPTFSRAYSGLSFTHFQNAFLDLTPDRERQIDFAIESAAKSLDSDSRDPSSHWAMGRALWLRGDEKESFSSLERSIELSPNFALGHYTLGFVHSQTGDPRSAIDATTISRQLSPFDPLQFAMLASRALAHIRLGELSDAAEWATRATRRPNAHVHILAIAVESLLLTNRRDEARKLVARIRERDPSYGVEQFLRAFRFDANTTSLLRKAAKQISF